jgi:hypothetical protein
MIKIKYRSQASAMRLNLMPHGYFMVAVDRRIGTLNQMLHWLTAKHAENQA